MTRVAYVCADPGIPVFGTKGASVHVQEIIRAWRARGAQVEVYAVRLGDEDARPSDLADLAVHVVPVPRATSDAGPAQREVAQQQAAARLGELVVQSAPDVVYERYSLFSTVLQQVREQHPARTVLEVNAPLIDEQAQHRVLVDEAGANGALAAQLAHADVVACVSEPVAQWVRSKVVAADSTRPTYPADGPTTAALNMATGVTTTATTPARPTTPATTTAHPTVLVVPNGVNTHRITPVTRTPDPHDPVVAFVGTLKPWHGVEDLLDAAAAASRPWRLRLIGDGPQRGQVETRISELGLVDQVELVGAVLPEQIPAHLQGSTVAVAPYPDSTDHYFSPLKVYEYAAAGLPVVASRIGQLPQIVQHERTGLLVPPSDPTALAAAIDALVSDPTMAAAMGAAGRELMVAQHSWEQVLETTLAPLEDQPGAARPTPGSRHTHAAWQVPTAQTPAGPQTPGRPHTGTLQEVS